MPEQIRKTETSAEIFPPAVWLFNRDRDGVAVILDQEQNG